MISFDDFILQGEEVKALREQIKEGRLIHALLITGEAGTGKKTLATLIANSLMCKAEKNQPCGECVGCRLAISGEHPDIIVIEKGKPLSQDTAKGRSTIPVDDIREMIRMSSQYSFEGGNRAVIVCDAENMTIQAQNCLLKFLEEPPPQTYFVLTTSHPDKLLTTVKSRCRTVKMIPWPKSYVQKLLTEAGTDSVKAEKIASVSDGSIGKAIQLVSDDTYWKIREDVMNSFFSNTRRSEVFSFSSRWKDKKNEADILFSILEENVHRLLQFRYASDEKENGSDFPEEWRKFAAEAPPEHFAALSDKIKDARKQSAFNVNFQAIIEQLLLAFIGEHDQWVK